MCIMFINNNSRVLMHFWFEFETGIDLPYVLLGKQVYTQNIIIIIIKL